MIIGDGIVLGAGGETASIVVTAPTGSTVTCTTPGGIVLTAAEVNGTWAFAKLKVYGTYTVTATDGTKTATSDVVVDSAIEYAAEMEYKLWLYKDGDECIDVTGGWTQSGVWGGSGTKEKLSDSLHVTATNAEYYGKGGWIATKNKVSTVGYSIFGVEYTGDKATCYICPSSASDTSGSPTNLRNSSITGSGLHSATYDISSVNISGYVTVSVYKDKDSSGDLGNVYYKKIWLE